MRNKPSAKPIGDPTADSAAYLADWASRLAEALSPDELAQLAKDYDRLARDSALSPEDRKFARSRAAAIRKHV